MHPAALSLVILNVSLFQCTRVGLVRQTQPPESGQGSRAGG